jgi:hypothetical protein
MRRLPKRRVLVSTFRMNLPELVRVFDSHGEAYRQAFEVFLQHTDQKANARDWLNRLVESLPRRRVFIDAGAGDGIVTAWCQDRFERAIAIEPNPFLRNSLCKTCAGAEVLGNDILSARPGAAGNLVLCSHVFYYIDKADWMPHLDRLASWLSADGVLVVVLQNPGTDCMKMLDHFFHRHFDLPELATEFERRHAGRYRVAIETVPAHIRTADFASACTIAEFMLNLLPIDRPMLRSELERWVAARFADPTGGFCFSCHQDFLTITPTR